MFVYVQQAPCPLCGASPEAQHLDDGCDGNVGAIIQAASAEIAKIETLTSELFDTVGELKGEREKLLSDLAEKLKVYDALDAEIRETVSPQVGDARATFSSLVEERASVQKAISLYDRLGKLERRKQALLEADEQPEEKQQVTAGIPDSVSHALSLKIGTILRAWNFPGECHVHFDKVTSDFVIDGKPRGSRGKGLRAITHASVTIALLEYCQEHTLSHPGFVVLNSRACLLQAGRRRGSGPPGDRSKGAVLRIPDSTPWK